MKKLKTIGNIIYFVLLGLLILVLLGTIFSAREAPGGLRVFVVQSGSMEPEIPVGSIIVTAPQNSYSEGEVISFLSKENAKLNVPGAVITHRITSVSKEEGITIYNTKGDSNRAEDREIVKSKQVLGKVKFKIPYAGYVVSFTRTQHGFTLLVVIPAVLIAYHEILNIKEEIIKIIEKKKKEKVKTIANEKNKKETKK